MTYPPGMDRSEVDDGQGGFLRATWYWTPDANPQPSGPLTDTGHPDGTSGYAMLIENTTSHPVRVRVFYSGQIYTPTVAAGTTSFTARTLSRLNPPLTPLTDASQMQGVEVALA